MNKVIVLFDSPSIGQTSFISEKMNREVVEIHSPKSKRKIFSWIKGCIKALIQSKHNDIIVCWFDFQAVLCYWLRLLMGKKINIVCINLMLKRKATLKNKVVTWLYKCALKSNRFVASVTSVEYGKQLQERLNIHKEFVLIHDVYHEEYKIKDFVKRIPNTVFCGGRNGRDWNFMIKLAETLPEVEFHLVMPKDVYTKVQNKCPQNIVVKCNLLINDFMKEMCQSELVALPLDTEAPAGLIVMFQAAANKKYILTTDTVTTREYLSDGRGLLLPNDVNEWAKRIRHIMNNNEKTYLSSEKFLRFLEKNCTEDCFVKGLECLINKVYKNEAKN